MHGCFQPEKTDRRGLWRSSASLHRTIALITCWFSRWRPASFCYTISRLPLP